MSTKKETVAERIARMAAGKAEPAALEHLNKSAGRGNTGNWGGKRAGAGGVKPTKEENLVARGIKKWLDDHATEKLTVTIQDPKTKKTRTIQKTRLMIALEKLYKIGVEGEGNAEAIDKWLNRILGKPIQPLGGDEDQPIVVRIDF